jgi:phage terminase large subunit
MSESSTKISIHLKPYLRGSISKTHRPIFNNKSRYCIVYGGAGSGKSHAVSEKILKRFILQHQAHKILIVRKVGATIKNSVWTLILNKLEVFKIKHLCKINKTDKTIELFGNIILFAGLDDVEKLKSIEGITSIWGEEASEFTEADLDQLDLRLRGKTKHYKQIILTFNPIHIDHWIKKKFFDRDEPNAFIHHSTYLDNKHIDDEYKAVFERLKQTNRPYYNIYALGHWGVYEGLVFEDWKEVNYVPDNISWRFQGYGIDFGFNAPSAVVNVYIKGKDLYWDECIYQSGLTNTDLIARMKQEDLKGKGYADSAEPDRILEIQRARFNCSGADKANRIDRINFVKSFNIHITKRSANLIKEMHTYTWAKDRLGNSLDEPVKVNDHAIDGACYASYTQFSKSTYDLSGML